MTFSKKLDEAIAFFTEELESHKEATIAAQNQFAEEVTETIAAQANKLTLEHQESLKIQFENYKKWFSLYASLVSLVVTGLLIGIVLSTWNCSITYMVDKAVESKNVETIQNLTNEIQKLNQKIEKSNQKVK